MVKMAKMAYRGHQVQLDLRVLMEQMVATEQMELQVQQEPRAQPALLSLQQLLQQVPDSHVLDVAEPSSQMPQQPWNG